MQLNLKSINGQVITTYEVNNINELAELLKLFPSAKDIVHSIYPWSIHAAMRALAEYINETSSSHAWLGDLTWQEEDPWTATKYERLHKPAQSLQKSVSPNDAVDNEIAEHVDSAKYLPDEKLQAVEDSLNAMETTPENIDKHQPTVEHTLPQLFRSYKNSPHNPVSVYLKYAVHRIEKRDLYRNGSPEKRAQLDNDFLEHHQKGGAAEKNGRLTVPELHLWLSHNKHIIPQLLKHQRQLHRFIQEHNPNVIRNIDGKDHVALTRGLNVDPGKAGLDHALASYADKPNTGFGSRMHHRWIPLDNVWFSYDLAPRSANSEHYGPENEWLVSPHYIKDAYADDVKRIAPRKLYALTEDQRKDRLQAEKILNGVGGPAQQQDIDRIYFNQIQHGRFDRDTSVDLVKRISPEQVQYFADNIDNPAFNGPGSAILYDLSKRPDLTHDQLRKIITKHPDPTDIMRHDKITPDLWFEFLDRHPRMSDHTAYLTPDIVNQYILNREPAYFNSLPNMVLERASGDALHKIIDSGVKNLDISYSPNLDDSHIDKLLAHPAAYNYVDVLARKRLKPQHIDKVIDIATKHEFYGALNILVNDNYNNTIISDQQMGRILDTIYSDRRATDQFLSSICWNMVTWPTLSPENTQKLTDLVERNPSSIGMSSSIPLNIVDFWMQSKNPKLVERAAYSAKTSNHWQNALLNPQVHVSAKNRLIAHIAEHADIDVLKDIISHENEVFANFNAHDSWDGQELLRWLNNIKRKVELFDLAYPGHTTALAKSTAAPMPSIIRLHRDDILASANGVDRSALANIEGRGSKTKGPLKVWKLEDGRNLLIDGYHRFAAGISKGQTHFNVEVVGSGYTDTWATPLENDIFRGFKKQQLDKGLRGDWEKEGYKLYHSQDQHGFHNVEAYTKDMHKVGEAAFTYNYVPDEEDRFLVAGDLKGWNVWVHPDHQRKGLASAMYKLAEEKSGKKIIPGSRTPDGMKLWEQKDRKFGKSLLQKSPPLVTDPASGNAYASHKIEVDPNNFELLGIKSLKNGIHHHIYRLRPGKTHEIFVSDKEKYQYSNKKGAGPYYIHTLSQSSKPFSSNVAQIEGHVDNDNAIHIWGSRVDPNYKGSGYGRLAYLATALHHGLIVSGHQVSAKATEAYRKMSDTPGVRITLGGISEPHTIQVVDGKALNSYLAEENLQKDAPILKFPKLLYHETAAPLEDIKDIVSPSIGNITKEAYGEYLDPNEYPGAVIPAVFMHDESKDIGGYALWQTAHLLGKHPEQVTWEDLKNHGKIAVIDPSKHEEHWYGPIYQHKPNDNHEFRHVTNGTDVDYLESPEHDDIPVDNAPINIERGDYFNFGGVKPERVIHGQELVDMLKQHSQSHWIKALRGDKDLDKSLQSGAYRLWFGRLQKDAPILKFPKLPKVSTRPDQEVKIIGEHSPHSRAVAAQSVKNLAQRAGMPETIVDRVKNYIKTLGLMRAGGGYAGGTTVGIRGEIPKAFAVESIKTPGGGSVDERATKVHEGTHLLLSQIAKHYGPQGSANVVKYLLSYMHPHDISAIKELVLRHYGSNLSPDSLNEEILTHIGDLHSKSSLRRALQSYIVDAHDQIINNKANDSDRAISNFDFARLKANFKKLIYAAREIQEDWFTQQHKGLAKSIQNPTGGAPDKVGILHPNGMYISVEHPYDKMPNGQKRIVFMATPEHAEKIENFIKENRDGYLAKHPKEHHPIINAFFNRVMSSAAKHIIAGWEMKAGKRVMNLGARHLRQLLFNDSNAELKVLNPRKVQFTLHERHGVKNTGPTVWSFTPETGIIHENAPKSNY